MLKVLGSNSYPKFQIILCKTDIAVKAFCLVQAGLKWAFWTENKEPLLCHFKPKKQKNSTNQCQNNFLSYLMRCTGKILFLDLV